MPNGFHGSKAEWERIEAPLQKLDPHLGAFSQRYGIALARNDRDWPDRSLKWGDRIRKVIAIYLEPDADLKYSVCFSALEDRRNKRYWKREFPRRAVPIENIEAEMPGMLEQGRILVESWTSEQLEFATRLSPFPRRRA
jgi:hypothetical protein